MIKKVLIMSASTGGGHNRAARAIKEELESRTIDNMSIECEIVDSLKLVNNTMDKVISGGYEKSALYTPKAYGSVYRFSETSLASKNEFKGNPLTSLMARKFKHLLNDSSPDLIIGTHPFPMIALSTLKKNNNIHSLSRSESFYKSPEKLTVLLMGGSFGAGNIKETLEELLTVDRDFQILVVTGRNEHLKDRLSKMLDSTIHNKNICLLGYTNKMNDILASIDVLISKPGGLTTTEALLNDVPMIVPYFIPGQEEENLDFLTNCGAALRTTKKYSLPVLLKVLIDDPSRLDSLRKNIKSIRKFNSAVNISNLVVDILSSNE